MLRARRRGQELLLTAGATEVECQAVALGAQARRFVHRHAANGVCCHKSVLLLIAEFIWARYSGHSARASHGIT